MLNKKTIFIITIVFLAVAMATDAVFAIVNGNYNRTMAQPDITRQDWNWLDEDYVLRAGTTFDGNLNLNTNHIFGLNTNALEMDSMANVGYVSSSVSSASGGSAYTNWGKATCESTDNLLYAGFVYTTNFGSTAGSGNQICINLPNDGDIFFNNAVADKLYPLKIGNAGIPNDASISTGSDITNRHLIPCASCFRQNSGCYISVDTDSCASGFSDIYKGFLMGSRTDVSNSGDRFCINKDFDYGELRASTGSSLHGDRVENNFDLNAYSENSFIKCALCCN